MPLSVLAFIISFISEKGKSLKKRNSVLNTFGEIGLIYVILIKYTLDKKEFNIGENNTIVKQQILKMFGSILFSAAKKHFSEPAEDFNKHKEIAKALPRYNKELIFRAVCQLYVYNNTNNYKNDGYINEIERFFNENFQEIKNEYLKKEQNHEKDKRKRLEEKRHSYYQSHTNYRLTKSKRLNYYKILGLSPNVTDDDIKKRIKELAMQYHPDRYGNNTEEQKKGLEKFKEITEAYNYIRKKRGF